MNIAAVDLNLLKVFEALLLERHVTRAGERIGLAQPSMSNALSRLRYLFDDELFVRTPQGMQPTAKALVLAQDVMKVLDGVRAMLAAEQAFEPVTAEATIKIAAADNLALQLACLLGPTLSDRAPLINLRFWPLDKNQLSAQLDEQRVDMAIGSFTDLPKRYSQQVLFRDKFVCLARSGHPAMQKRLTLKRFVDMPHVLMTLKADERGAIDQALQKKGLKRRIAITVAQFTIVPQIVACTDYLAAFPASLAKSLAEPAGCTAYAMPVDIPSWPVQLVWSAATEQVPVMRWIRTAVSDAFA